MELENVLLSPMANDSQFFFHSLIAATQIARTCSTIMYFNDFGHMYTINSTDANAEADAFRLVRIKAYGI
jgi:hypothetical protein